jgi:putative N6-adenine-specific DNA methylase
MTEQPQHRGHQQPGEQPLPNGAAAPWTCTAVLPPGLEQAGAEELVALGARAVRPLRWAVRFEADAATFYRLHLQARLPFRLLRQLAVFPCQSRDDLYAGVQDAADWQRWLPPEHSFRVDASGSLPGLSHGHYSALQVKNALVDWQRQRWGRRSSVELDHPDLQLHLHLGGGQAQLSVDGSGESLHRRGYRARMGLAPLKENLAAGLIRLTGWDGQVPLADPLCGSGTLLIEAACLALGHPPGLGRHFALERWPDFNAELWERESEAAAQASPPIRAKGRPLAPIVGRELDPLVAEQARANAAAAAVADVVRIETGDLRTFQPPPGPGVVVCNPPYGERIGEPDALEALYSDLGALLKERCSGWDLWLLSGNPKLSGALRMKASRRLPVSNGGIDCRWLHYTIR